MVPSLLSVGSLAATHPFHLPFYFLVVVSRRRGGGCSGSIELLDRVVSLLRSVFHSAAAVASAEPFPRRLAELLVFAASFRLLLRSGFVPYFLFPISLAYFPFLWLLNFNLFPFSSLSLMSPKTAAIFVQSGVSYFVRKDVIAA